MGLKARAGMVTLLLLVGAAACGDDDADGTAGAGPANGPGGAKPGNAGGGESSDGDACSLLEVQEIEAEFGDRGAVADGEVLGFSCSWEVGDVADEGYGAVAVTSALGNPSAEQALAEIHEISSNQVEVDGIGDQAFLGSDSLWFRSGDQVLSVSGSFITEVDGMQEKLTSLAQHMLDRL
ncbi:MAG TPA: hypothetical protein VGJ86_14620 [Acidimicrobiales bacterium]